MRHPIYIMAAVTSALALAAWGGLLWQISPKDSRRTWILALLAGGLVMSPLAFFVVRRPLLIEPLEPLFFQPGWNAGCWAIVKDVIGLCFAPLTEEPAKLVPWLVLLALGAPLLPTRKMVAALALAIGLGFAVGEIWLVAYLIAQANDPKLAGLAWYDFGGFCSERLMTCLSHALFALPTVSWSRRGWRWGVLGVVFGMLLHWFGNAPIALMHRQVFGWRPEVWSIIASLWVVAFAIAGLLSLVAAAAGRKMLKRILSHRMVCPGCGETYRQPILMGLNFGMYRYEPCGVCHKWHWVTLKNLAP